MMRFCPKCGDYYADASLAFCLGDGTPLINVNPLSESWSEEGIRVIEEKENALRKQKRILKWRRVVLTAMLMATMVVLVVAVNSFIYLQPQPEEAVPAKTLTSTPAPGPTPAPTPSQTPTPTPSPTPTPTPLCSDADKSRERKIIIDKFGDSWRRNIEGEQGKIIDVNSPPGAVNVEASLGALKYESAFIETCERGSVTVKYAWQVSANFNGTIKSSTIKREKRFSCVKSRGTWLCR